MVKVEDLGNYYRIPVDNRDLNYNKYYNVGQQDLSQKSDYHSHNTHRLSIKEIKDMLLKLELIQNALQGRLVDEKNSGYGF